MTERNNTGNRNTGNWNTGRRNTGTCNTGHYNAGNWNTGCFNTGTCNTGARNTGHYNAGDWNAGNWNAGCFNTGDQNAGNWNAGNWNTGCFNTMTPEGGYFFNKWLTFEEWRKADIPTWLYAPCPATWVNPNAMSDDEKECNPKWEALGGYLRKNDMKEEWRKAYEGASNDDVQAVRDLPNFDYDVFQEITGLDLRVKD